MKQTVLTGRPWLIVDEKGQLIDNIDTDQIYHNAHLAVTDPKEMAKYAFGNLAGWEDFPEKGRPGDILFVGENFGAGSSRQHAVNCFLALGVAAIVGKSFGAIYKRNAINSGLPLLELPEMPVEALVGLPEVTVNLETGEITGPDGGLVARAKPMSKVALEIYQEGGLLKLAQN
ncbi:MAG: 3-isopropylmalate dehydratase, small subunit [Acetothermia bacterium 64_32]|nr:MAG: 3-isopropylmalate dehydratase, small subunit [Acetothermia bacterium 64_32]HAF70666.1 3-isopropylmalate dehydratase [Candidatus Acetothermia bacterium]